MKLRLHGTRAEVAEATRRLLEVLAVVGSPSPVPTEGRGCCSGSTSRSARPPPPHRRPPGRQHRPGGHGHEDQAHHPGGGNQHSGLEVDRHDAVHQGPDPQGRVWVFHDNRDSFCALTPAEYREVPAPPEPHDLVHIDQRADGFWAVCVGVWRHWQPVSDPNEAARSFRSHLHRMDMDAGC